MSDRVDLIRHHPKRREAGGSEAGESSKDFQQDFALGPFSAWDLGSLLEFLSTMATSGAFLGEVGQKLGELAQRADLPCAWSGYT